MNKGLIGKKLGMTQIFDEQGKVIPVTVIEAGPCVVAQVKTVETDGYNAIQLGFGDVKESKVNKPVKGHFAKSKLALKKHLREFRLDSVENINVGDELKADTFTAGVCVVTSMEEPLGKAVGNSLEVIEAIEFLQGNMQPDVKEVILALGSYMIKLARKGNNIEENKQKMLEQIQNGQAFAKLEQWIQKQGGDISYLENTEKFEKAKFVVPVISNRSGYVKELLAQEIGKASMNLGAGRKKKEDNIDFSVGIVLEKKIGDKVENRDILAYVHANDEKLGNEIAKDVLNAYTITNETVSKKQDILKIV